MAAVHGSHMLIKTAIRSQAQAASTIDIVVADDHAILRAGLRRLLEDQPDFRVVGDASSDDEAIRVVTESKPHVVIAGFTGAPLMRLMRVLPQLSRAASSIRTIVLTKTVDRARLVQALQLGARGLLAVDAPSPLLFKSVRSVAAGQYAIAASGIANLVDALHRIKAADAASSRLPFGLTSRELDIVAAVRRGESNKAIARRFAITVDTVKHHLTRIYDKTGVMSRLALALLAIEHDFASGDVDGAAASPHFGVAASASLATD